MKALFIFSIIFFAIIAINFKVMVMAAGYLGMAISVLSALFVLLSFIYIAFQIFTKKNKVS